VTHEIRGDLKSKFELGDQTISDIIDELKKPNRDPREGYPKPIMQKGVISFEDLKEGMMVTGKIKNVVDFGAFVDIGLKETALLHLSEMSDHFVKDPMDVVKVGDVRECRIIGLDVDRKRISLSCKTQSSSGGGSPAPRSGGHSEGASSSRRVVVARKDGSVSHTGAAAPRDGSSTSKEAAPAPRESRDSRGYNGGRGNQGARPARNEREDDGMTYNPFAALLKDRK